MADTKDIVPELYEQIQKAYKSNLAKNQTVKACEKKLEKGKMEFSELTQYAGAVGDCAGKALLEGLSEENLPGGLLYWNIAERTIGELLREVFERVMETAKQIQKADDEKTGISLEAFMPDFPERRIKDLQDALIQVLEGEDDEQEEGEI